MKRYQPVCAVLGCVLAFSATLPAQQLPYEREGNRFIRQYRPYEVPPVNLANSTRLESLLRAGRLYLSLQDAIALALENNLDIEYQRYGAQSAEADILRAESGSGLRGVSTNIASGSAGQTGQASTAGGTTNQLTAGSTQAQSVPFGTSTLNLDPAIQGTLSYGHRTAPQTNSFTVGSNSIISRTDTYNFGVSKGFLSGATASLGFNNANIYSNSSRNDFNPYTQSALTLTITQPLLQGFGFALNNRFIRIAKNNLQVSDLVFKEQVIATVSNVIGLYHDLVGFNEDVRVKREAVAVAQRFYADNKKQVEVGTMAPIEIVRAEAEVAAREQDLTISETNLLQQETIIKNALSRNGIASPAVADARLVATDRIRVPDVEQVQPIQDLVATAMHDRPELAQNRIQIENSKIALKGTKNALLPSVNAFTQLTNNALAGQVNTLPVTSGNTITTRGPNSVDQFLLGGYGTVLGQLFGRNFPDYAVGVQLNIPLRNRAAQADVVTAEIGLRQQQIREQQAVNQVRVDVQNALIALQQARARYQAALKARILQEQTLDAVQKKFALGASTSYEVIQTQRDLATAQGAEVTAMTNYARARNQMDVATGQTLEANNIVFSEAVTGHVSKPPAPLPVLDNSGGAAKR